MFTITFNSKTSPYASKDIEENVCFLRYNEAYLNSELRHRGYVYINEIYQRLGIGWNPDWDNLCRRYDGRPINFKMRAVVEDGYVIDID